MLSQKLASILALCSLAFSLNTIAAENWHTSTLKSVYPLADGAFVLIFDTDSADCSAAGPGKYHYITPGQNGMTVEGAKKLYAAALTALAADKIVQIAFDNATTGCYINRLAVVK